MALFYQAETKAFGIEVVRKAFTDVGLLPWSPQKNLQNCQENSPPDSPPHRSRLVSKLLNITTKLDSEKCKSIHQLMCTLEEKPVITQKKVEEKNALEQKKREKFLEEHQQRKKTQE